MKIGIIGWGLEGQSAYRYFGPKHQYLIASEEPRQDFPAPSGNVKIQYIDSQRTPGVTGNVNNLSYLNGLEDCDKIVYTPTARKNLERVYPPDDPFWSKATTNQHIFFEHVKTKNIIGVTGTKGKGTTCTLIAKMLEASGKKVHLGGNIGRPLLDFVRDVRPQDWVVLELANFQLYNFVHSPHIAVCLMIVPEHMDWHPDMPDYIEAKGSIFRHQTADDIAIYFPENEYSTKLAGYSPGLKIPYYERPGAFVRADGIICVSEDEVEITAKSEVKLLGEHNLQNVCAAVTATWQVTQDKEAVRKVLGQFTGLEHRLELVRELEGVKYYDDSFGTTPETAIVAIRAFKEPKIVILGGSDKGADYSELAVELTKNNVRHTIVIGDTAPKIIKLLKKQGFTDITEGLSSMPKIVNVARELAQPGDIVLLSAASASFGLFRDYKDRGNQFKEAVRSLS